MKKSKTLHIFNYFMTIMAVSIVILTALRVLLPFYMPALNKDLALQITATGEKNDHSLGNNVRINNISINGKALDLSKESLIGEWKYSPADDFIYAYDLAEPEQLSLQLTAVHSIEITFISEQGSGTANIQVNGREWKILDLYSDQEWGEKTVKYDTSWLVFPERNGLGLLIVLIIGVVTARIIFRSAAARWAKLLCGHYLLAISLAGFASIIQYHSFSEAAKYFSQSLDAMIKAIVLIFIFITLFYYVLGKTWSAYLTAAGITVIANILNVIKLENRGMPFLPWDYQMFYEAFSVTENYHMTISYIEILVIVSIVVITVNLALRGKAKRVRTGWKQRLGGSAVLLGIIVIYISNSFLTVDETTAKYRTYQVAQYYEKRGFITAFMEYLTYLNPAQKPEGYNKETMTDIRDSIIAELPDVTRRNGNTPNIIVIMSESFWDIKKLDSLTFETEPLPVYEQLKKESLSGNLFTHVFGGGTVVSEFEFLTGFSGEFFPKDYMVYGSFLKPGFSSAVSILESQGYQSLALHPYIATNYNREKAYLNLGFDRSLFIDDFDENVKKVRNYVSDEAIYERIIEEFEEAQDQEGQPMFIFAVTMQNHGGYWQKTIYDEGTLEFTADGYQAETQDCITDYVRGLHESDRALGEFVDYFRNSQEDTIIIYFGDHMSDAGPKNEKMLSQASWADSSESEVDYQMHIVPFIAWSNFDNVSEDIGIMEAGQLFPTILDRYEMNMMPFWRFLIDKKNYYSASDGLLAITVDSHYIDKEDMDEEQKSMYDKYELLQYDYIWGKKYAGDLWENNFASAE